MNAPAVFTRDNPCTKVHLWNCFRRLNGYPRVSVVDARAIIGVNAPKYLIREGLMTQSSEGGVDYYKLTTHGVSWLEAGVKRHLELHPKDAKALKYPIPGTVPASTGKVAASRVVRRVKK